MKKSILFLIMLVFLTINLYAKEVYPDDTGLLGHPWINLKEPKNNEKCINVKVDDKTSKCFVIYAYYDAKWLNKANVAVDSFAFVSKHLDYNNRNEEYRRYYTKVTSSGKYYVFELDTEYEDKKKVYVTPENKFGVVQFNLYSPNFSHEDYYIHPNKIEELGIPVYFIHSSK